MGRNIVICADGTANTFDDRTTNVTRLIRGLDLRDHRRQVAVYAQGLGTNGAGRRSLMAYQRELPDFWALRLTPPPVASWFPPKTWVDRVRGLAFGHGLSAMVRSLYRELTQLYEGPDDRVFLFGFSRGAFAVRALAGLLHRCHLPPYLDAEFDERFARAWDLYRPIPEDRSATAAFRAGQRPCGIHFLGLWDTVKSYGGLKPVVLPHLRHNPIVAHVRHALALDERRAWFKETTWGRLDLDRDNAMTRLDPDLLTDQNIAEVWFTGCHSDIGGGNDTRPDTAVIALRWMLGEAVAVDRPLELDEEGWALLDQDDEVPPRVHQSFNARWNLIEWIPRQEPMNGGLWPKLQRPPSRTGERTPAKVLRDQRIRLHTTADAGTLGDDGTRIERVHTRRRGAQ
jgi:uncharacterized protein (DUF2235 family)